MMGVKMGWIQIKMGNPLAQNGAALAPFRANGAHLSMYLYFLNHRSEDIETVYMGADKPTLRSYVKKMMEIYCSVLLS